MKRTWILLACSLLIAIAAASGQVGFASTRSGSLNKAECKASCGNNTFVSCIASSPSQCTAVDSNCPSVRGYAQCGTNRIDCPVCPTPQCTEGSFRFVFTGECCDEGGRRRLEQQCIGGVWQYTGNFFCGGPCGPILP